jgi:hypothetical protein
LLTGLGWLLRSDDKAAHSNFRIAISQIKSMGDGNKLAYQYWRFVQDLVPAERAASYAQYFDTRAENAAPAEQSAPESTETEA